VILVTANYRLGALGFMALDQLRNENPQRSTGAFATFRALPSLLKRINIIAFASILGRKPFNPSFDAIDFNTFIISFHR
jgi:hypothetical protein